MHVDMYWSKGICNDLPQAYLYQNRTNIDALLVYGSTTTITVSHSGIPFFFFHFNNDDYDDDDDVGNNVTHEWHKIILGPSQTFWLWSNGFWVT